MIHGGAMYSTKYINTANTNNLFSAQSELNVSKSPPLLNGFIEACVLQLPAMARRRSREDTILAVVITDC